MSADNWDLRDFTAGGGNTRIGRSSRLVTLMLVVLVALVASGLVWANWARIEQVTRGDGRVVPSGRARTVESLEGGIVRGIEVREGDTVGAGQVLVRISDIGSAANLGELRAQQRAFEARNLRLEAEARGEESLDFAGIDGGNASPQALREVALFQSRLASYRAQRNVLQAQLSQRREEIAELQAAVPQVEETLALLEEEIDLRATSGVVSRAQILPLERERAIKRQEQGALVSKLAQARSAEAEAEARLIELELNRRAEISAERSDTLNQKAIIDESIKRASDIVARASLRAPVDGIVSVLNVNTIGSVIQPGEEVLRIVPDDDQLQVEARIAPKDIAFVRPDLPAKVKITAFDFTIYGSLPGNVLRVGADAEQDEATGEVYFPVIVETQSDTLEHEGRSFHIRPGMVVSIDIMTGEQTVLDYLLKPFRKARLEALRER
ncbi:HlyD family type I secretion periplasmic adaptor subunit [Sedimentitalea sp.]|uniref:HlyD family type I secretion periplasmic adaptor subunit n=1 Tax=Sedimentitalea sp. TaxID=2048915 RepID=UPI0032998456